MGHYSFFSSLSVGWTPIEPFSSSERVESSRPFVSQPQASLPGANSITCMSSQCPFCLESDGLRPFQGNQSDVTQKNQSKTWILFIQTTLDLQKFSSDNPALNALTDLESVCVLIHLCLPLVRWTYQEFFSRYRVLMSQKDILSDRKLTCQSVLERLVQVSHFSL